MTARRATPIQVADNHVRGWLENQVRRNQLLIKSLAAAPTMPSRTGQKKRTMAEAAAIIKLAGSCLDHLDAEARQARTDAAVLAEGNPAIP